MSPMSVKRDGDQVEIEGSLHNLDAVGCFLLIAVVGFLAGVIAAHWWSL